MQIYLSKLRKYKRINHIFLLLQYYECEQFVNLLVKSIVCAHTSAYIYNVFVYLIVIILTESSKSCEYTRGCLDTQLKVTARMLLL